MPPLGSLPRRMSRDHAAAPNASQNRWPNWNLGWEMMTMGLGSLTTGIFAGALLGGATVPKAIGNLARGSSVQL